MSRFKLKPYAIRLYQQGNTDDMFDLSAIVRSEDSFDNSYFADDYGMGTTLIDIFEDYCEVWHDNPVNDQDRERTLSLADDPEADDDEEQAHLRRNEENNILEGVFKYGVYGTSADHLDPDTGEREEGARSADEAAETPIPFLLHIPERNPRKAVMVLESVGTTGVKSLVEQEFRKALPNGIQYKFPPVKEEDVYSRIRAADEITRVRLGQSGRINERNDTLDGIFDGRLCNQSTIYNPTDRGISIDVDALESWIEGADDDENPFNFEDETFELFNITIKESGSEKTIYLTNREIKIVETLDDINTEGGYPVPSDVSRRARVFVNEEVPFAGGLDSSSPLL